MNKTIISVSRRTDIPAYYSDWFRSCMEKGFAYYKNPFSNKPVFTDLSPQAVKAFVLWTRNPTPLLKHLDYIDERYEKKHYMHFTINGLPAEIEKRNPAIDYAISSFEHLAKRYGSEYTQWRFDPIVFSSISTPDELIKKFTYIASRISGMTRRCYFSFVDLYDKTAANLKKISYDKEISFIKPDIETRIRFVSEMDDIAKQYGMTLYSCAEDDLLNAVPGIEKAHCIDGDIIKRICRDDNLKDAKFEPSRIGCGCIESRDIGFYDSCPHGCVYCYANRDPEAALENARRYLKDGFPFDDLVPEKKESELNLFDK